MHNKRFWTTGLLLGALLPTAVCAQSGGSSAEAAARPEGVSTARYEPSRADFPNPERGFYADSYFSTEDAPNALDAAALVREKEAAGFQVSLIHRSYYLPGYRDAEHLPQTFLDRVAGDLASARRAGVKLILRFAYRPNANYEGEPVYRDPTRGAILQHLEDLAPVLGANAGVIAYVDAGLLGAWGEWHSATPNNRDDDPANDPDGPLMDELYGSPDPVGPGPGGNPENPNYALLNWDRKLPNAITREIVDKLLEVVPGTRAVAIRYPLAKAALLEGEVEAALTEPLADATAYQNTPRARLGAVNDCFLASVDDFGTYYYGGIPGLDTPAEVAAQIEREKDYLSRDNLYLPMGGETCADEPYTAPGFRTFPEYAKHELERLRWSTLNIDYNENTLDALGGYLETVKRRLGYRLVLQRSSLPGTVGAGARVNLRLRLTNAGYASPFNPRGLEVVFRKEDGSLVRRAVEVDHKSGTDPRYWKPGETTTVDLPVSAPEEPGTYRVLLNLPDPLLPNVVSPTAAGTTPSRTYAIRLANEGVWEADTGLNQLAHTLTVR